MLYVEKLLVFLILALLPWLTYAQIFVCKDASGRTLTSDRPMPECADRAMREMDKSGLVRRHIPAPLTPEQKQQKQLEEEKRKAEEAALADQVRQDNVMRAIYRNENDIEAARKRALAPIVEVISREEAGMKLAEQQLYAALSEAQIYKGKADIPTGITRKVERSQQTLADRKRNLQEYEDQRQQINTKYDKTLARFRELVGR